MQHGQSYNKRHASIPMSDDKRKELKQKKNYRKIAENIPPKKQLWYF